MANARHLLSGALTLGFALAPSLLSAQVRQETTTTQTQVGATTQIRTVSSVIGSSVKLQDGTAYGKIEDIVLNDSGCLEYVVVTYEDSYYVVPWTVTRVDYQAHSILLNTTPQILRQVIFSRNDWRGVTYDTISRRTRQVFSSPSGDVRERGTRRERRQEGRPDLEKREGPLRKARPADRPPGRVVPPETPRPGDQAPEKKAVRPRPRDDSDQPKRETRPEANPSEPKSQPDQPQ